MVVIHLRSPQSSPVLELIYAFSELLLVLLQVTLIALQLMVVRLWRVRFQRHNKYYKNKQSDQKNKQNCSVWNSDGLEFSTTNSVDLLLCGS